MSGTSWDAFWLSGLSGHHGSKRHRIFKRCVSLWGGCWRLGRYCSASHMITGSSAGKLNPVPYLWGKSQPSSVPFPHGFLNILCSFILWVLLKWIFRLIWSCSSFFFFFWQHPTWFFKGKRNISPRRKEWCGDMGLDACGCPKSIGGNKIQFSLASVQVSNHEIMLCLPASDPQIQDNV